MDLSVRNRTFWLCLNTKRDKSIINLFIAAVKTHIAFMESLWIHLFICPFNFTLSGHVHLTFTTSGNGHVTTRERSSTSKIWKSSLHPVAWTSHLFYATGPRRFVYDHMVLTLKLFQSCALINTFPASFSFRHVGMDHGKKRFSLDYLSCERFIGQCNWVCILEIF